MITDDDKKAAEEYTDDSRLKMLMSEITEQKLKELNACKEGIDWFLAWQGPKDLRSVLYGLVESSHGDWANWLIVRHFNKKQKVQYAVFAAELVLHIFEDRYPEDKRPRKAIEAAKVCIKDLSDADAAANAAVNAAANAAAGAAINAGAAFAANAAVNAVNAADAAYTAYGSTAANAANAAGAAYTAYTADAAYTAYAADAAYTAYAADAAYTAYGSTAANAAGAANAANAAANAANAAAFAADYDARKSMRLKIIEHGITLLEAK